ncbi:hypothetical protein QAD02_007729 [Eretmocerus hayati]|uniref:Uncharacterized protein n=1 Tax=Eretmocerus hayati TaxID=131215 RepID=A0ACC2N4S6_9HYME|nr:hypothetical protein QAD02_007729 [Eretmocerus hayati]
MFFDGFCRSSSRSWKIRKKRKLERISKAMDGIAAAKMKKRKSSDIESVISYRIVDLSELGRSLECLACGTVLSLENIVSEKLLGLHSALSVKCHPCGIITPVATGRTDGRFADINKVIVLCSVHSGVGCVTLNEILATADLTCGLEKAVVGCGMEKHFRKVVPFLDTLSTLRKKAPDRKGPTLFKVPKLAEDFLEDNVDEGKFHDALYDVIILGKIVKLIGIEETLVKQTTNFKEWIEKYKMN